MRVFIAGAAGVLGCLVTQQLVEAGHSVTGLFRRPEAAEAIYAHGGQPVVGDLLDLESVRIAARSSDAILHLATACPVKDRPGPGDWDENSRLWREGVRNLLLAAKENRVHSYVQQSLGGIFGDVGNRWLNEAQPPRPRAILQAAVQAEELALQAYKSDGVPIVLLRGAALYGADSPQTRRLVDAVKTHRFIIPGSGRQYWHWLHLYDMAQAVVTAAENPAPGEVFFVADDWPFHAGEGMAFLAKKLGAPPPREVPLPFARPLLGETAPILAESARFKNDKLKRMLGWAPRYPTYHDGWAQVFAKMGLPF